MGRAIFHLMLALVVPVNTLTQAAEDMIEQSIQETNQQFMRAFNAGNIDDAVSVYTEDAIVLPPDHSQIEGREGIASYWRSMADKVSNLSLNTLKVEAQGDLACEVGTFSLQATDESGQPVPVDGKYVVIWKKTGDAWKWHVDIWNTNAMAAAG